MARLFPCDENGYFAEHAKLIRFSFERLLDRPFPIADSSELAFPKQLYHASFAVLAHDGSETPMFTYANLTAQNLFEMSFEEITQMPSSQSAEMEHRSAREKALREVMEKGYIEDYSGIRISKTGKRFRILDALLWNLVDSEMRHRGQAVIFYKWQFL